MKHKMLVSALVALSLLSAGSAFSQPGRGQENRENRIENRMENRRDYRQDVRRDMRNHQRWDNEGHDRRYYQQRGDQRGAGPNHGYYRGDRLPAQYRSYQYVVEDWRGHHLSAPPRGYHWVQNGGDYLLVAITTGVILHLLLNN
jgi:Ni/Co efflux regulator RcnB